MTTLHPAGNSGRSADDHTSMTRPLVMALRRVCVGMAAALWAVLALPATALADSPTATDFRSEITSVSPPTDVFEARIIGGDSLIELRVRPGSTASVEGYQREPFLRFEADGTVMENRASLTYYASQSRYGSPVPDGIDATTEPIWVVTSHHGVYAWHDHRIHWMGGNTVTGHRPGDVIQEQMLAVVADGTEVRLTIAVRWVGSASASMAAVGALIGIGLGIGCWVMRRRFAALWGLAALLTLVALRLGWSQFHVAPASVGRSVLPVALPAAGVVCLALVWAIRRWPNRWALLALGAVELVVWAVLRRDHVRAAVLPTTAPFWLDRAAVGIALPLGLALAGIGLIGAVLPAVSAAEEPTDEPLEERADT